MKIGSLFDGSGGFPLAASKCGITPTWASEVEPYPVAVTKSRFPKMVHLGDVSKIQGGEVEPVDVITFGSPCQDLSVAGKRAGLKHTDNGDEETTRSGLFMEAVRIIKEMREATNGRYPAFALWENVPGAFSSNHGEDFRTVLQELIQIVEPGAVMPEVPKNGWPYADSYIGNGWSLAYRVLDAQYWGVPQRRRRIYLVLDLRGERAGKILFERESLRGYFAEGGTPWQATAGDAETGSGADDRAGDGDAVNAFGWPLGFRPENVRVYDEVATTICNGTRPGFCNGVIEQHHVQPVGCDLYNLAVSGDVAVSLTANTGTSGTHSGPTVAIPNLLLDDQGGQQINVRTDDKCPTLRAEAHGNVPAVLCMATQQGGAEIMENKCPTITAAAGMSGNNQQVVAVMASSAVNAETTDGTIAPCLMARAGTGGNQLPLVAVKTYDARGNGEGQTVNTITGDHNNRITDYTSLVVEAQGVDLYNQTMTGSVSKAMTASASDADLVPCALVKSSVAYSIGNGQLNQISMSETCNTLDCMHDKQAVLVEEKAYGWPLGFRPENVRLYEETATTICNGTRPGFTNGIIKAYGVDARNATEYPEMTGALQADSAHNLNSNKVVRVRYIVRRLTPTECARLQGFPDAWGHPDHKDSLTDEEYAFWLDVRNTHAAINGKAVKEYTREQMLKWYNGLHTDSSEYKMWGNGIALPCALYVMQGIQQVLCERYLSSLFGGESDD